jgi:hypothetical protein
MALSTLLLDTSVLSVLINNTDIPGQIIYSDTFVCIMRIVIEMTLCFAMSSTSVPREEIGGEGDG